MLQFVANSVVVDDTDEEFILVGLADEFEGQYREALHFQRSHQFDAQDLALGMDQVYVERNGQAQSAYGGIERVELYPRMLRVGLSGGTAEHLGATTIEIAFALPAEEFNGLRSGLRRVFAGFEVFTEHSE